MSNPVNLKRPCAGYTHKETNSEVRWEIMQALSLYKSFVFGLVLMELVDGYCLYGDRNNE